MGKTIRIGGACGFWGDSAVSTPQLLRAGVDYLIYDYLAEITMSILAKARAKNPQQGYATDFVTSVLHRNLPQIAKGNVKLVANAGGVNPVACAEAIGDLIQQAGLNLKVAVVTGDDLLERAQEFAEQGLREMFSGQPFPRLEQIASVNAYLGAFPIAKALEMGADIVITGRCVDSALTLGIAIHELGWQSHELNKLAQGSLAGHLIECGTQATGGNFTDWKDIADSLPNIGYPIAEMEEDGSFVITKPQDSGGLVSVGTVAEQLVYEIGDPQQYTLPDVVCDFSQVQLLQQDAHRVLVQGAKGFAPPETYKVSATYADGFRGGHIFTMIGPDAEAKAQAYAENVLTRCRALFGFLKLPDFKETSIEIIGTEAHYGNRRNNQAVREVDVKLAATHASEKGIGLLLKEMVGMALSAPPGLTSFAGARPKPSPVVRLFSFLLPRQAVRIQVQCQGAQVEFSDKPRQSTASGMTAESFAAPLRPAWPSAPKSADLVEVPLQILAWGRSGDKGNLANIGIIARKAEFLPWLAQELTPAKIEECFQHFLEGTTAPDETSSPHVERYLMPGLNAINIVLHGVLGGGGVASLRTDPQGKSYAQLLMDLPVRIPNRLLH